MTEYMQKLESAKDDKGKVLAYDGTTDCAEFLHQFDAFCESRGFGGVVSRNNYEQPRVPVDVYGRIASGVANERDAGTVATYEKANAHFISKCQQVAVWFKAAVVQHIRMLWQGNLPEAYRVGNRANLEILRNDLILRYGGWTDAKGQLNFNAAEALGPIVNVDTCLSSG